ncbi:hypothetical protein EMIHUDRAFT_217680 [Emiliania huxleyi CCMP1516]|uniref:Rhodanese domain-containing protein n=2 Tax=Emiliania huxleyi TaxID=2903 RepID=A0A0D3IA44_EMIH1|nr:hypothetical protein EMIHUDRAFT_217680 [Emiliania huxleyi CCMP1516]EOD08129.1 hypothetical protein EMIHUDRAFT_217680 [Emiliania huxleyi CCMP1516]|eukprot:XP_005760558.1 hypothetical protein EMIHUDRAFT_217680 [Emiliania huxleyi CCMP1516]
MRSYIPGASSAGLFVAALAARPRLLGHNRVRSAAGGPRCAALGSLSAAISDAAFSHAVERAVQERGYPHQLELPHFLSACGLSGDGVAFVPGAPAPEEAPLVLDVRSPCEFAKGHLPGAVNMPLFSDEERAVVGTLYKQQGPEEAVAKGVRLIEASWRGMVDALPPKAREGGRLLVYCKRGGMRSGGAAWLLSQLPLEVVTLRGGYQGFRRWVREEAFQTLDRELVVLGGRTGSGKTDVLLAMAEARRAQVVDLEGVAQHRGSSFGALGRPAQPSNEMCVLKLERKLGSGRAASLVSLLLDRSPPALGEVADLLLTHYYDSMYEHQAKKRPGAVETLPCDTADADAAAAAILRHVGC